MPTNLRPNLHLVGLSAAVLTLVACMGGPGSAGSLVTRPPEPAPSETPAATMNLKIYLFLNERLVAVHRSVPQSVAVARAAINELIAGPGADEGALGTAVPAGTTLLGLNIAEGLATIDLSKEFESGGGSASMFGRLAQVVFTLTQFPTVERVVLHLDGEPVTVFSGEGIVLDHPLTRSDYESFLPPIFIDGPAWGGTLANPGRIVGLSNVFEATFRIAIKDASGRTLADEMAMATCGTGCWGTFDVSIPYSVSAKQSGTVSVYSLSAQDGSIQDLISYPVTLTP
jgi:hypothetical protein